MLQSCTNESVLICDPRTIQARVDETYVKAECRQRNYSSAEPPCQRAVEVNVIEQSIQTAIPRTFCARALA